MIDNKRKDVLPRVISACQDIYVEELKLDSNIAKNDALKVRTMLISILVQ